MTNNHQDEGEELKIAEPVIHTRKSFSIVWLVPLVALLVGGWLAVKAVMEKGPTITISFSDANGLEAGKTKIKYKEVDIGQVETIHFSEDASHVIVKAKMVKEAQRFLSDTTRFWVVRARVTGSEVSGLTTLFSGAYIAIDPGKEGKTAYHFNGLETPPVVTTDLPGRHFRLSAEQAGSVDYGSPVYYRQIKVGEVEGVSLDETGETVTVQVFIQAPYQKFVHRNTRFWQASGLDLELSAQGLRVDTQSLVSLMVGGIAFGIPDGDMSQPAADADAQFRLYENYSQAQKRQYDKTERYLLYFDQSVRGLSLGAPVEFRGIQIGEVADVNLESGEGVEIPRVAVSIDLEVDRCGICLEPEGQKQRALAEMVKKGLRAQLKLGNLLTGQLYVALDYYPDASPQSLDETTTPPVIPTVSADLEGIVTNARRFMARLDRVPLEEIGKNLDQLTGKLLKVTESPELKHALLNLDESLEEVKTAAKTVNTSTLPALDRSLSKLEKAVGDMQALVDPDAPLQYELLRALEEVTSAAKAVRNMADTIDRKPESLIRGK